MKLFAFVLGVLSIFGWGGATYLWIKSNSRPMIEIVDLGCRVEGNSSYPGTIELGEFGYLHNAKLRNVMVTLKGQAVLNSSNIENAFIRMEGAGGVLLSNVVHGGSLDTTAVSEDKNAPHGKIKQNLFINVDLRGFKPDEQNTVEPKQ